MSVRERPDARYDTIYSPSQPTNPKKKKKKGTPKIYTH